MPVIDKHLAPECGGVCLKVVPRSGCPSADVGERLLRAFDGRLDAVVLDELHFVKVRTDRTTGRLEADDGNDGKGAEEDPDAAIAKAGGGAAASAPGVVEQALSNRRSALEKFVKEARKANARLKVLGLTATPVVNSTRRTKSTRHLSSQKALNLRSW